MGHGPARIAPAAQAAPRRPAPDRIGRLSARVELLALNRRPQCCGPPPHARHPAEREHAMTTSAVGEHTYEKPLTVAISITLTGDRTSRALRTLYDDLEALAARHSSDPRPVEPSRPALTLVPPVAARTGSIEVLTGS